MSKQFVAEKTGNVVILNEQSVKNGPVFYRWRVEIKGNCRRCKKDNTFYNVCGCEEDAKKFANDVEHNYCIKCS